MGTKANEAFEATIRLRQEAGQGTFCCLGMAMLDDLLRATLGNRQGPTGLGFPVMFSPTRGLSRSERPVLLTHGGSIVLNYCPSCGHHYDARRPLDRRTFGRYTTRGRYLSMDTTTSTATPRVLQIEGCPSLSVLAIPPTITSPTEAAVTRVAVVPVSTPTSTGYPNLPLPARADGNRHQRRAAAKARRSREGRERAAWYESLYNQRRF